MAVGSCPVVLVVLVLLWTFGRGDAEVCIVLKSCILPCSFQPGDEMVIHWILENKESTAVHSYYYNQDQLTRQDKTFRGRTSLFKDQISSGNASLRLTNVSVQDHRIYKCYTSSITGIKESLISLNVEAPVSKVNIQQEGNRITCGSEGIYPEPELTWSTSPPSNETLNTTLTTNQTEQQLYSISSSLMLSDKVTDLVYSCTVSTRSSWKRASLLRQAPITFTTDETTINCNSSNTLTDLIWRFNHNQVILKQSRSNTSSTVSEGWRKHVRSVSQSGSLTLQDLSSKQEGVYTCELSDAKETHLTITFLRVEESQGARNVAAIAAVVIVGVIAVVVLLLLCKYRKRIWPKLKKTQTRASQEAAKQKNQELHCLNDASNGRAAV